MVLRSLLRGMLQRALSWLRAHPSAEVLQRFVLGDLSPGETARVLQHLLPGCDRCQAVTGPLWSFGDALEAAADEDYQPAMDRALSSARQARAELETGRRLAERWVEELEALPAGERLHLARSDPRYLSWALCELLLERSHESARESARAESLAELAVAIAERLAEEGGHPPAVVEDLRASAWGGLAAARCLLPDLPRAEQALSVAREHLGRGTGDRLGKARLLEVEASLRETQGRLREAMSLRRRAENLYLRTGQA